MLQYLGLDNSLAIPGSDGALQTSRGARESAAWSPLTLTCCSTAPSQLVMLVLLAWP